MIGFIVGFFVGGMVGIFVISLMVVARDEDERRRNGK